jgi:hypothetical protein
MRNNAALLGGFDVPGLGDYEQAGLTLDADGALWTVNQVTGEVIQFAPGEPYAPWDSVAWLQTTPVSGVVAVGVGQPVALMLDATGLESGDYVAHLRVNNSTPYGAQNVPVVLRVLSNYNVTAGPTPQDRRVTLAAPWSTRSTSPTTARWRIPTPSPSPALTGRWTFCRRLARWRRARAPLCPLP